MEDDKLKNLFAGFQPPLSSDREFMRSLERRLEAVEMVREHLAAERSRNRKAVVIAAMVGFVAGFLFSLALPYLSAMVADWKLSLPSASPLNMVADNFQILAWLAIVMASTLFAVNAFELSTFLLKSKS